MSGISDKDKKDWQDFISSKESLPNKDFSKTTNYKIKKAEIDLHGCTLDEANIKIENFILEKYENGFNKLRVVTGKGLHSNNELDPYVSENFSILKYSVPDFIRNNNDLMKYIIGFKEAPKQEGGDGAFYILLKKKGKI